MQVVNRHCAPFLTMEGVGPSFLSVGGLQTCLYLLGGFHKLKFFISQQAADQVQVPGHVGILVVIEVVELERSRKYLPCISI